jgi:transposase
MLMKTLLNHVQPFKGFVYNDAKLTKSYDKFEWPEDRIVFEIVPRKNSKAFCSGCGIQAPGYDTLPVRLYDYLAVLGVLTYFAYARRRVKCADCGVKAEMIPWANGNSQLTLTLQWYLADWAKDLSWKAVASKFRVSWDSVCRSVEMAVEWGLDHRSLTGIKSIGVDEIAHAKGHKYLTLVYQIDADMRRLLWIGNDRTEECLKGFFTWFGKARSKRIEAICSDMWKPYLNVIKELIPNALHVLDRFHIAQHMGKAIDEVRAEEHRKLQENGYEAILTKTKWLLLRNRKNLKEDQEVSMKKLLKYNLKTMKAYLLKEEFSLFWTYSSPAWAGKFLDQWCTKVRRSKIEPLKKKAKMLRRHKPLILNWFKAKGELSSGVVEGLNLKAKLTARKSYGFKNPEMQKIALYHQLGKLPTPEWTHKFC